MPVRKPPGRKTPEDKPTLSIKRPGAKRTKPRVNQSEPSTRQIRESIAEKQKNRTAVANIIDGEVVITGQVSETVPVAQYANVVILSGLQWKHGGIDLSVLDGVDWGEIDSDEDSDTYGENTFDYSALTPEQRAVYDRIRGALRSTMKLIEHGLAEDRDTVERSVRLANEREAAEEAAAKKEETAAKQRRRAKQ